MAVGILVESVVCPRSRYPAQALYQRQDGWREMKTLCDAFKWDKVPWEDPSEQHGIRTSANFSRYRLLLEIAHSIDGGAKGHYRRFPHLLERDPNTTIYVPYDLPQPIRLKYRLDGKTTKTLAVGSSLRLYNELQELEYTLDEMVVEKGENANVVEYPLGNGSTWGNVHDLYVVFRRAAKESMALNLPFCIRY